MSFGRQLRELRRAYLVPKERVAETLGLSPDAVLDLEDGRRLPTVAELRGLAQLFNLPEAQLLSLAGYVGADRPHPTLTSGGTPRREAPRERERSLLEELAELANRQRPPHGRGSSRLA